MNDFRKRVGVKYVGSTKETETVIMPPGTSTRDLLRNLGLDPAGFQVLDSRSDTIFAPDDIIFARVQDGDLVHVSANVVAGLQ